MRTYHSLQGTFKSPRDSGTPTAGVCQLIKMVLMKNLFAFNKTNSLQIHGTAMGTIVALSYTNLFVGVCSNKSFYRSRTRYLEFCGDILTKCLVCGDHGEPCLWVSVENLNCHHPAIKLTASWSAKEVTFLETRVYLSNGQIGTDLYVKPTDTHQFLEMDSCHPHHCKILIPYRQSISNHQ